MTTWVRWSCYVAVALAAGAWIGSAHGDTVGAAAAPGASAAAGAAGAAGAKAVMPAGAVVSDQDKLQFTQQNVQAQMQELQDRMFHLAEITKPTEPDDATRLVLAVRKAREQLIMEQMKDVLDELKTRDLSAATGDSKKVILKLEELKRLLVATDLEMQLQLERLKKIQTALKQLDAAIKEEKSQTDRNTALADQQKQATVAPESLTQAKNDQDANRLKTDTVAQTTRELGKLDQAASDLGNASTAMNQASGNLGNSHPGDAVPLQFDATKKMESARAQLEQERKNVLAQLQQQVRGVVLANLSDMLDRQVAVRQATENLSPKLASDREALMHLKQLGPSEERISTIAQETLELVTETEFSVALPPALESLEKRTLLLTGDLGAGHGDAVVIASETGVERDIKDLIDTFKQLSSSDISDCQGKGGGSKNKLLAELRVVRMLQVRVNEGTVDAEAKRAASADLAAPLKEKIAKLRDDEGSVQGVIETLHQEYGPAE